MDSSAGTPRFAALALSRRGRQGLVTSGSRARRRGLAASLSVAVAGGALGGAALVVPAAGAHEGDDHATVPFHYAVAAKKHGKKGTRLTRFVVKGVPAEASLNVTCFPAGVGCPASGTMAPKASTAADGTQTFRFATKGLGDWPVKSMISISASATGATPHLVQLRVNKPGKFTEIRETM